ncbi:MAG TPA: hypothetical protein VD969_14030 [Symbiobacteriaceae bacterium]|nr:hypothetical protein [Symbiobacteriaceae bacterium]
MGLALAEPGELDLVVHEGGARVYLERRVADLYEGAKLGWEEDMWGGGFTFRHPDISEC